MQHPSTHTVPTMSSLDLVDIINSMRPEGSAELRHDNFMKKIENHPGITSPKFLGHVEIDIGNGAKRKSKCYHLPKRECELLVMSESLEVQTKVYDRMVELEQNTLPRQPNPNFLQTQVKELGFLLTHSQPDFQSTPELADQIDIMRRRESAFRQIILGQTSVLQEKPAASVQPTEYASDSPVGLDGLPVATLAGSIPVVVVKGVKYVGVAAICNETGINIKKQQETKAYKEQKLYAMVPTSKGLRRRVMLPASVFELKASQHRLPERNRESLDKTLFFVAENYSMLTH